MNKTVLLVAHSDGRDGRVAPLLEAKGYRVEWRCPMAGEMLPDHTEDYAGAVVFGGVQSANDTETVPYMRHELDWIGRFASSAKPFLGICLGAQLLAKALGAKVGRHPEGLHEIGYYPLTPTPAGRGLIPEQFHVYHWHKEGFEVPACAELLATGQCFENQAFRYGTTAYGLQFHPEVTPAVMRHWLKVAGHELPNRPGAQCETTQLAGSERHDPAMHDWADGFLGRWINRDLQAADSQR